MTFTLVAQGAADTDSNGTSLTPAMPAGIAEHDVCFCQFQNFGGTNSRTPSISTDGWNQIAVWQNGTTSHGLWWYRVRSASDGGPTIDMTGTGATNDTQLARIVAFRPGSGNFAQNSTIGATSTNASADSVGAITGITGTAGALLVMSGGKANDWNGASTAQAGWSKTNTADTESTTGNDAGMFFHYILNYGGGATGNLTVPDDGGTNSNGVGLGIIVQFLEAPLKTGTEAYTFADKRSQMGIAYGVSLAGLGSLSEGKRVQGFGASDPEGSDAGALVEAAMPEPLGVDAATLAEATALDTGAGASKSDTDSATLGESPAMAVADADSATLAESPAIRHGGGAGEPNPITDPATLTELASTTADVGGTDSGTQGEGVPGVALGGPVDNATLAESGSVSIQSSGTDINASEAFSFREKQVQTGILDTRPSLGSLGEVAGFIKTGSDSGSLAEGATVVTPVGGDDYRVDDESSDIQVFEPGSDATLAEAFTLTASANVAESIALGESAAQLLTLLYAPASDTGALGELALVTSSGGPLIVVDQTGTDSASLTEADWTGQPFTSSDSGALAESSSLAVGGSSTPSDRDAFVFPSESVSMVGTLVAADPWTLAETAYVPGDGVAAESASWGESALVEASAVGADSVAVLELIVLNTGQTGIVMGSVGLSPRLTGATAINPRLTGNLSIRGDI